MTVFILYINYLNMINVKEKAVMTHNSTINETERILLECLGQSLKSSDNVCEIPELSNEEWERIYSIANRHEVSVLMEDIFNSVNLSVKTQNDFQLKTARTVHKGIRLQSLNTRLTALLEKEGVRAVTLKGYAVARLYPVPEFRKTTDIDFFLFSKEDEKKAVKILCENGFRPSKEWHANHHSVLFSERNESVELHTAWADEFRNKRLNKYLENLQKESVNQCRTIESDGQKLYVYDEAYQAFYLLIHMLGHFVGGGFGLRNLCDWVVLWENCENDNVRDGFIKMVSDSSTEKFAKAVTSVCVEYLGLSKAKCPFPYDNLTEKELTEEFLRDILDAGEFGYSESERMVGMDGSSFISYIKEFHHQMHINFPKAGRVILLWPVLWIATLFRFLSNNKKLNRAPFRAIINKAGERGRLVKRLTSNKRDG